MLYQLSYLGTARRGGQGAPVYSQAGQPCPCFARVSGIARRATTCGCAWCSHPVPACPAWRIGRRRPDEALTPSKQSLIPRLPRHPWRREWRKNLIASGSDRHPGSARNKTGARPRLPAWRRSGTASPWPGRRPCAAQLALSQPKRIGKPSPPSSAIDSYSGSPTILV